VASVAFGQVASGSATTNGSIAFSDILDPGADAAASPLPNVAVETDRIIVTGSNIPTAEEVGANPVVTIGRELIDKSGERTAEELIKNLPEANANGVPISNNAAGFTPGASSISLRGFDPDATLVLIDGRRVAPYPIGAGADGTQSFVDLNSIPTAAIQSVEVLKDGASAIYGADAVAGVVNIKFRHNYHGAAATVEYGNTLDKDSGEENASVIFGAGDEKTLVTGVMNFYHRNSIANRDRGFSAKPPALSTNASPYNLRLSRDAVVAAIQADPTITPDEQGALIAGLPADSDTGLPLTDFFGHAPFGTNGIAPVSQYVFTPRRAVFFNYNQFSSSFPDTERYGGFVNTEHKVWGDRLVAYGDLFYQNVQVQNELAPSATGDFLTPGSTTLVIPPQHPVDAINPATGQPFGTTGGPSAGEIGALPGAFNPFNPFQQFISGGSRARLAEFGDRLLDNETDAFMTTLGLKGEKLFDGTWGYDAGFRYSQIRNTSTGTFVSGVLFDRILNANDPIFDPSSSQFIGTTIPFNPFTDYRVPFASNLATVNFATVHPVDVDTSKLATLDATIYTTALFQLPAGGVGLAFGGQFRRENIEQDVDLLENGDIVGSNQTSSTKAGRKSYGIYVETNVPLFSAANRVPVFHALDFTAAARFEAFRSNDTNVLVPKFGMRWQPFDETLTIRSTCGEGFLQPTLFQLFGSSYSYFGGPVGDTPVTVNSNPVLQPEDSRNFTAGIVYTPKFAPGLTLSFDFYDIDLTGAVILPDDGDVLDRDEDGALLPGETVLHDPANGEVTRIIKAYQNGGTQTARGVDLGLQYSVPTSFGIFTSLTQATYLDSFLLAQTVNSPTVEVSNTGTFDSSDAYLKWKGISRFDWAWKHLDVVATVRFIDGFHEIIFRTMDTGIPYPDGKKEHWVDGTWFFDAQATYDLKFIAPVEVQPVAGYSKGSQETVRGKDGKAVEATQTANYAMPWWKNVFNNTSITIGCNNVFGQDPPQAYGGFRSSGFGYPASIYDATGRFVYISLTKKF
jgi:iron complex outermembrane recepter protein